MTSAILILLITFVVLLLLNVPVAFCLGLATVFTMLASIDVMPAASTAAQRLATGLDSFTLLAIPFFILSGYIMGKGGIARRLINFALALVGALPGGLAFVNIVACMLFGSISGSAIATSAAIGSFMHPKMVENNYSPQFSAAINIASSTTGLIIPPSNVLIVYSLASGGVSIAALFVAGYLPGLLLGGALMIVAGVWAHRKGFGRGVRLPLRQVLRHFIDAVLGLSLVVIVIGGIVGGIFTATEAAAVAVIYSLILSMLIYREVKVSDLSDILTDSIVTTAVVMLLIGTSMGLSWVLSYENIPQSIAAALVAVSHHEVVLLLIINAILLIVGIFMDMTPAILIFTPIFLPVAVEVGVDPVHFGILMVFNLCIGLTTPPVGTVLFAGAGVAKVPITDIIRPLVPLYLAMLVCLMLVTFLPEITLFLPRLLGL
jgi:tripartite ATP-independent transporter DctM subunit